MSDLQRVQQEILRRFQRPRITPDDTPGFAGGNLGEQLDREGQSPDRMAGVRSRSVFVPPPQQPQAPTSQTTIPLPQQEPQPGFHMLMIQLTLGVTENGIAKKYYVKIGQGYIEQGATWRIAAEQREVETRLKAPAEKKDLYPGGVNAEKEIAEALAAAAKSHKRVLLVFGGNWCYDCHVLDEAFHTPEIAPTLNRNFVVAHIDIGEYDKNLDLAKKYEVPLKRGVPAAAVLESDGKLLFTQKNQEFEKARSLAPEDVLAFLNKWKPPTLK